MPRFRLWPITAAVLLASALVATQHFALADATASVALRGFESCEELHAHYVERARSATDDRYFDSWETEEAEEEEAETAEAEEGMPENAPAEVESAVADSAMSADAPVDLGETSETGTNVQERSVDESDIIKTDGSHFYILRSRSLLIAKIGTDGPATELGRVHFDERGSRQELLIGADRAIVIRQLDDITSEWRVEREGLIQPGHALWRERAQTEVLEIDISDAAAPRLLRELNLDGRFLSARLVGDGLRIAMQHNVGLPVVPIWSFWGWNREQDHERYNEALREELRLGQWYPLFGLEDHVDNAFSYGYAVDCGQTFAPQEQSGQGRRDYFAMAFMLSFDLASGIGEWGSASVLGVASPPTVYASRDSLYIAAPHDDWRNTAVHRFDISDPLSPSYFGGAVVEGWLLSQWSLSEHEGYLRVATTDHSQWPTVSSVTILEAVPNESDEGGSPTGVLREVGRVSGLGETEQIYAVRFMGDVGYVVTFREVDPLYVLDLSDPADPRQVGELKIPGFSRYLHPLSGGLLFALGRDADPTTGRRLGLQASLFDVSDLSDPTQMAVLPLGDAVYSPVESDHRAFRYHDGVAWIPVGPEYSWLRQDHDGAFLGVRVTADGLTHESTLRVHGEARRAIPLGEQIHLLSSDELRSYALDDYVDLGALNFTPGWDDRWTPVAPE